MVKGLKIVLNSNNDNINIIKSLRDNDNYCPSKEHRTEDTKCICKEFRDKNTLGTCRCGLYKKVLKYNYIAVDFDGTIVEHKFPDIGPINKEIVLLLNSLHDLGTKIILHTCREDGEIDKLGNKRNYLTEAVEFCKNNNIFIDAVNENPWVKFGDRKIYADIYIDDRALNVSDIIERL